MNPEEAPIIVVGDVVLELRRLSSLCHVMAQLKDRNDDVDLETLGDTMGLLRDFLDIQAKALDGIRWKPERR